jgi:hypothetical protein
VLGARAFALDTRADENGGAVGTGARTRKSERWRSCAVAKERAASMGEVASNRMTVGSIYMLPSI